MLENDKENLMDKTRILAFSLAILLILLLVGVAWAGSSANYAIDWWVFSGGGAPASSSSVSLNGSLGQTAVGLSSSSNVSLNAGYWRSALAPPPDNNLIYLPVILRAL